MTDSRVALLAAAAEEFAQFGLHGARIRSIVTRAGVNERMIYHHFGSKEGLYGAVMDEQRLALLAAWTPTLEKAAALDPVEGLRTALRGLLDALIARPQVAALLTHETLSNVHGQLRPTEENLPPQLHALYQQGQEEGLFRADVPFTVVYMASVGSIVGMAASNLHYLAWVNESFPFPWDSDETRGQLVDQFLFGMAGPPGK
jgi:AcrR family transcriptional regulator